ncbi:hypothetical protein KUCAC02_019384 [Chaenocephalus aceratus]|uniref:Uncharacterized protein n=1 Tax=Chaenocephalus aceratus TaxID=36190 RepID=A0ACB9VP88_CHAAC|nr:hypothetical protein KUCAC02_019384 [Chaenocephalus aceratus]
MYCLNCTMLLKNLNISMAVDWFVGDEEKGKCKGTFLVVNADDVIYADIILPVSPDRLQVHDLRFHFYKKMHVKDDK